MRKRSSFVVAAVTAFWMLAAPTRAELSLVGHSFMVVADIVPVGGTLATSYVAHFKSFTVDGWFDDGNLPVRSATLYVQIPQSPTRIDFLAIGNVPIDIPIILPNTIIDTPHICYGVVFREGDQWRMTGFGLLSTRFYQFGGALLPALATMPTDFNFSP